MDEVSKGQIIKARAQYCSLSFLIAFRFRGHCPCPPDHGLYPRPHWGHRLQACATAVAMTRGYSPPQTIYSGLAPGAVR